MVKTNAKSKLKFFPLLFLAILLAWGLLAKMRSASEVNLIASRPLPGECYYQRVQCVKEPCEPILVCPPKVSPSPISPTTLPMPSPTASCRPRPACLDSTTFRCMIAETEDMCPRTSPPPSLSPKPSPTPTVYRQSLVYFSASNPCGEDQSSFAQFTIACKQGGKIDLKLKNNCNTIEEAMTLAQNICNDRNQPRDAFMTTY